MPENILWRKQTTNLAPPDFSCFPNYCFTINILNTVKTTSSPRYLFLSKSSQQIPFKKMLKHKELELKMKMLLQLHLLATKWLFKAITQYVVEHCEVMFMAAHF